MKGVSMQDSRELHEPFIKELKALLRKYDTALDLEYDSWLEEWRMVIDFQAHFMEGYERSYSQLQLPRYIDGTED